MDVKRHATGFLKDSTTLPAACRSKLEIPKDKLTDQDFDQIVVATSASVTSRARQLMKSLTPNFRQDSLEERPNRSNSSSESSGIVQSTTTTTTTTLSQPKRPMNAFMVWGQAIRRELHNMYSNVQNALLSKALGRVWKRLDLGEKEPYINKANLIKTNHKRDYPNYRYQPRRIQEKPREPTKKSKSKASSKRRPPLTATTTILSSSQVPNVIRTYSKAASLYNDKLTNLSRSSHQASNEFDQYGTCPMSTTNNVNAYQHQTDQLESQWAPVNMVHYPNGLHVLDCGVSSSRKSTSTSTSSTVATPTTPTTCNANNITHDAKYSYYYDDLNIEYQLPPPIDLNNNNNNTNNNNNNITTNQSETLFDGYQPRVFYEQPRQHLEPSNQNQQYSFANQVDTTTSLNLCTEHQRQLQAHQAPSSSPQQQIITGPNLSSQDLHHLSHPPLQTNNNDHYLNYRQQQQIDLGINQPGRYGQSGEQMQYLDVNSRQYSYNDYDQYHQTGCLP